MTSKTGSYLEPEQHSAANDGDQSRKPVPDGEPSQQHSGPEYRADRSTVGALHVRREGCARSAFGYSPNAFRHVPGMPLFQAVRQLRCLSHNRRSALDWDQRKKLGISR